MRIGLLLVIGMFTSCVHAALSAGTTSTSSVLVVASLNPIATDLIRQVGGPYVEIVELVKPGMNPHEFQLSPGDLREATDAVLIFAMGWNLEGYLPDLRNNLQADQQIIEIGATIPVRYGHDEGHHDHSGSAHRHDGVDPHWWQSIENMQRATRIVSEALSKADPVHREEYQARARVYRNRLMALEQWVRQQMSLIPAQERKLATSHAAFNYFCEEFGFQAIAVKGLTTREEPTPAHLAEVIEEIRSEGITTVFPEVAANPKILQAVAQETGVRIGQPLYAGSPPVNTPTYEALVRHNVTAIVDALVPEKVE